MPKMSMMNSFTTANTSTARKPYIQWWSLKAAVSTAPYVALLAGDPLRFSEGGLRLEQEVLPTLPTDTPSARLPDGAPRASVLDLALPTCQSSRQQIEEALRGFVRSLLPRLGGTCQSQRFPGIAPEIFDFSVRQDIVLGAEPQEQIQSIHDVGDHFWCSRGVSTFDRLMRHLIGEALPAISELQISNSYTAPVVRHLNRTAGLTRIQGELVTSRFSGRGRARILK